ncbi:mannose-1-phosphate guanylyltransferase/mannose-6-phosphate isomerase [Laribacter hongkongensis]|uniref:mannose-1-phosphate guanylyltransferase/mannose-6-phosphate isomerase n=1 Tax=Laribacter hongkongensis TaxID=168471 RepID=UPI001EFE6815|nr:mannose-1-phosphate guanylyltransferase/mannose-6-phosphate isomerase [Laribacter hongkongensis]MCG9101365.1 mannose-1-phosphate guanylyltransferase/mannose-6-phosphate isomerase [Laribacter hongkongensis]MCG9104073.1 mannose-1-phosphate guanylyltransferase/mannose-6-phosphate isomerase [Laribacter hongkongensis]MCG9113451.1 mannose-1-phosphate guanylyltransferase/mannose-6-phosphate isomerase [Laribacter hongkongensis]MCG9118909.1 mannose-1-phosphate guanylyltransferase/mannose-6-phosphate 
MHTIQPVILCGGSGTRLWPLSRSGFPKQFLCLAGMESLFQQAARRLTELGSNEFTVSAPLIVSNEEHRFMVLEQLRETGIELGMALLEPVGRNTAPALTLAALAALAQDEDPILVVTPADHTVADQSAFTTAMQDAIREASTGTVVILGVFPDRPETGYGYIKAIVGSDAAPPATTLAVELFVEKPDASTAQRYLEEGGYYWNAGIFVLKASVWMAALQRFREDIAKASQHAWNKRSIDQKFVRPGKSEFLSIPAESVDYAVMEYCPASKFPIRMVPLDAGWNDLGAWDAVWKSLPHDDRGNVHLGNVLTSASRNTLAYANSRLVALVGVENLVVIETADAVLVANKSHSQDVKAIVEQLSAMGREERMLHRKVHRPWGWYDTIDEGLRFKVKRIQVKPKASLSLQKHQYRSEHWVVIKGRAEVTLGNKVFSLNENQSTFVPVGEVHRLANPDNSPLEIIEVQTGSYFGEDDIIRFEDSYGRWVE